MNRPPIVPGQMAFDLGIELTVSYPLTEFPAPQWGLRPFSGSGTKCPKCGSRRVYSNYEAEGRVTVGFACQEVFQEAPYELQSQVAFPEHLDRSCTDCGHFWVEEAKKVRGEDDEDE